MNYLPKTITSILAITFLLFGMGVSAQVWEAPTAAFPDNNALAPINVGATSQTKLGDFYTDGAVESNTSMSMSRYSTNSQGDGYCFGGISGGVYNHTLNGCITDWESLMFTLAGGLKNETLRYDGNEWVSNGLLKNDGKTVFIERKSNGIDLFKAKLLDTDLGLVVDQNGVVREDYSVNKYSAFFGDPNLQGSPLTSIETGNVKIKNGGLNLSDSFAYMENGELVVANSFVDFDGTFKYRGDQNNSGNTPLAGKVLTSIDSNGNVEWRSSKECDDGIDNDGDGDTDYDDTNCSVVNGTSESSPVAQCNDGIDNDGNGFADYGGYTIGGTFFDADPGCSGPEDMFEMEILPQCSDLIDNDGDGYTDYNQNAGFGDSDCISASDNDESNSGVAQCKDGIDNDGDGNIDFNNTIIPAVDNDAQCVDANDNDESGVVVDNGGPDETLRWDDTLQKWVSSDFIKNTGSNVTIGLDNISSGINSIAGGRESEATGEISIALGFKAKATGMVSAAFGNSTTASGNNSVAFGVSTKATGTNSAAFGSGNEANSLNTVAIGQDVVVNGSGSVGIGLGGYNPGFHTIDDQAVFAVLDGRTGLGTVSPQATLDLQGGFRFSGDEPNEQPVVHKVLTSINGDGDIGWRFPRAKCNDNIDNDGDGFTDFDYTLQGLGDPDCASLTDNDEGNPGFELGEDSDTLRWSASDYLATGNGWIANNLLANDGDRVRISEPYNLSSVSTMFEVMATDPTEDDKGLAVYESGLTFTNNGFWNFGGILSMGDTLLIGNARLQNGGDLNKGHLDVQGRGNFGEKITVGGSGTFGDILTVDQGGINVNNSGPGYLARFNGDGSFVIKEGANDNQPVWVGVNSSSGVDVNVTGNVRASSPFGVDPSLHGKIFQQQQIITCNGGGGTVTQLPGETGGTVNAQDFIDSVQGVDVTNINCGFTPSPWNTMSTWNVSSNDCPLANDDFDTPSALKNLDCDVNAPVLSASMSPGVEVGHVAYEIFLNAVNAVPGQENFFVGSDYKFYAIKYEVIPSYVEGQEGNFYGNNAFINDQVKTDRLKVTGDDPQTGKILTAEGSGGTALWEEPGPVVAKNIVRVRSKFAGTGIRNVYCPANYIVIGGGGDCENGDVDISQPFPGLNFGANNCTADPLNDSIAVIDTCTVPALDSPLAQGRQGWTIQCVDNDNQVSGDIWLSAVCLKASQD
ncbi:MAG: hypothetical protein ACI88L_000212 [Candidatus Paceibacteria bacterium]|jgi:hypothetical protein